VNQKIIKALIFQAMEQSALLSATGATVEELNELIITGIVVNTGNVSEYRDLQSDGIDEPMYILNPEIEVDNDH